MDDAARQEEAAALPEARRRFGPPAGAPRDAPRDVPYRGRPKTPRLPPGSGLLGASSAAMRGTREDCRMKSNFNKNQKIKRFTVPGSRHL